MSSESQPSGHDELIAERLDHFLELLKRRGLSQVQVATRASLPPQYLSDIKNQRRPLTELVARRLGEEFQTNFEWLLGRSEQMETPRPSAADWPADRIVWLPTFPHPIQGEPRAHPDWDGTGVEITGVAEAKSRLATHPYILRFGRSDVDGRLRAGDLVLISQASDDAAEIQIVNHRKRLFLARRGDAGSWIRLANGHELPASSPVAGYCVGIIWSPL